MRNSTHLILITLVLLIFTVEGQTAPRAEILEYGYYEFTGESERLVNPSSTTGYVTRGKTRLVEKTQSIPVERGRLFGFRFRIDGLNKNVGVIPLELVVEHPEMSKPDGSKSSGYRYRVELNLSNGVVEDTAGYRLNEPFELVEGDWRFEYRFMNKTLIEQKFTTYKPK